jgi:hypothetical protein
VDESNPIAAPAISEDDTPGDERSADLGKDLRPEFLELARGPFPGERADPVGEAEAAEGLSRQAWLVLFWS